MPRIVNMMLNPCLGKLLDMGENLLLSFRVKDIKKHQTAL